MLTQDELDVREVMRDEIIREMLAEIDRDTFRRLRNGERIVDGPHGPEWVYFVNRDGKVVDENGKLLD